MLVTAGCAVTTRDLIAEQWNAERLRGFFGDTPVASWFNPAAPRIKSGEVVPDALNGEAALALMLKDPLLIRRPLVEIDGKRCAGFDREPVTSVLSKGEDLEGVQGCTRPEASEPCPAPQPDH